MSENRRELVFDAFDNKKVSRVPVGFWFHFAPESFFDPSPAVLDKNFAGHEKYFEEFKPDFLKLMSDGFFGYPNESVKKIRSAADLDQVVAGGADEWIEQQVQFVKRLTNRFGKDVATFYNIFAPDTYLSVLFAENGLTLDIPELYEENPLGLKHALEEVAKDIAVLAKRVIAEGGADGIYLSVKNIQSPKATKEDYWNIVAPSELKVLEAANSVSDYNILHICGYEGARNDLSTYVDYPAKIINWAVVVEGVSLEEGKKLFGNRAVIGGFANTAKGILYHGTELQIKQETQNILEKAGTTGVILGADCTIPSDTPLKHLEWVRQAAANLS